jgi:NTE family protein
MRLTVAAVHVRTSEMVYFDSREQPLGLDHLMASGALPPAFPAIRIAGEPYWDGGLYSNTPLEAVLDDHPRRDSVIFAVNVWQPTGPEPESVWEVLGREKDIQYASRADSHIKRQKQIHRLRHVIRELTRHIPSDAKKTKQCEELASWGCATVMHVVRLLAPALASEDYFKDIDFSPDGIRARWQCGIDDTRRMLERAPWDDPVDPMEGIIVHELSKRTGERVAQTA